MKRAERLIGCEYYLVKPLLVYGICPDSYPVKKLDYYIVYEYPGIGGRFVLSKHVLPPGSVIIIRDIEIGNVINGKIRAYIDVKNVDFYADKIKIILSSGFLITKENGDIVPDEEIFKRK